MKHQLKRFWIYTRYWLGYGLFAIYVVYSMYQAPDILWNLHPGWLALVIGFIVVMFSVEVTQFCIFLHHHHIPPDIWIAASFTTQKSILNFILPAKTGTLLCIHIITRHYHLKWHEYVQFMIITTMLTLFVSIIAFLGLVLPITYFALSLVLFLVSIWMAKTYVRWDYLKKIIPLLFIATAAYLCRLFIFWALLKDLTHHVGFHEASVFAIVTIALAQVSITPGNMGIREMMLGWMAPYLSLPMSVGVIIGALLQIIRIMVYGIIFFVVDFVKGDRLPKCSPDVPPVDDPVNF